METQKVLEMVKFRLHLMDEQGEGIFKDEQLISFINLARSSVSMLVNVQVTDKHLDLIVQYAVIQALASKALVERGREYKVEEGVKYNPPNISEMLFDQYQTELDNFMVKIEVVRNNFGYTTITVDDGWQQTDHVTKPVTTSP